MKRGTRSLAAVAMGSMLVVGMPAAGASTWASDDGHTHVSGTVGEPERCGTYLGGAEGSGSQVDPGSYAYVIPTTHPGGLAGAATSPDHHWVHDTDADLITWDLGTPTDVVDLFPSIDHGPVPEEAIEATVYGSNDLVTWVAGDLTTVFDAGFDAGWTSDDYVSRWEFTTGYRYVGVGRGGPKAAIDDGDAEIDAACAPNLNTPDCSAAAADQGTLWPPNHKMVDVAVTGVTDADGDPVTIEVTGIRQDEPVNTIADGDTAPDGAGVGSTTASVRAERAGSKSVPGNGRVYHIAFTASDGLGGSCTGTVLVSVPHDQRGAAAVDDGPLFDSTAG